MGPVIRYQWGPGNSTIQRPWGEFGLIPSEVMRWLEFAKLGIRPQSYQERLTHQWKGVELIFDWEMGRITILGHSTKQVETVKGILTSLLSDSFSRLTDEAEETISERLIEQFGVISTTYIALGQET